MVIYVTGGEETTPMLDELTPRQIVQELDKYVVGQQAAKKAVAIALRNRIRRQRLSPDVAEDVLPKNILMIGPTGVGKTEIARRLARLSNSPMIKVEASKYTEVGYVGRDVESMIRDLVEMAVDMVRAQKTAEIQEKAERNVEERLLDLLLPSNRRGARRASDEDAESDDEQDAWTPPLEPYEADHLQRTREKLRQQLREGKLDSRQVEMEVREKFYPTFEIFTSQGIEQMDVNIQDMIPGLFGAGRKKRRRMRVDEAREYLLQEEEQRLIDMDQVARQALEMVEQSGIVFLDEIDKIAGRESGHGPDVSREGVQRDLLPMIEGTTVSTRYGTVRTDHILFIAAGAFHVSKPSDLIPELQGRFPIRVELDPLTVDDFKRILREPKNSLIKQYKALLETDGITLNFTDDAIDSMAEFAFAVNEQTENIGARRLQTIMEKVLEDIAFEAPDLENKEQTIDAEYVRRKLADIAKNQDLSRYIL
ncbi:MAG: ATP-dependent protease ATPase subunit HslU [Acidobacteriota bacterium]|nr:ATP-dependent protease ATPase subunit HslU [Blastocatellia bacterium]MDW8239089.1 ATP-dependent protease ATPase subunit HslU [Acidobacteriota bacterium]